MFTPQWECLHLSENVFTSVTMFPPGWEYLQLGGNVCIITANIITAVKTSHRSNNVFTVVESKRRKNIILNIKIKYILVNWRVKATIMMKCLSYYWKYTQLFVLCSHYQKTRYHCFCVFIGGNYCFELNYSVHCFYWIIFYRWCFELWAMLLLWRADFPKSLLWIFL